MTQSINFYSEIPTTKSLGVTLGSNCSAAPFLYCVICLWFIISFAWMFMCETLGAVTDASSCPRSAQRFGWRVAGQIYVCGWKAGALCWGRETVLWHPWGKYSGQGDWPRLSLSLSVSIKSRLSPQGCFPCTYITGWFTGYLWQTALPYLLMMWCHGACVKESLAAKSTC